MPNQKFKHGSLDIGNNFPTVFVSFSKRNFYLRNQISAFVLEKQKTPVSPFMNFDYNLSGLVDKTLIRIANNTLIAKAQELWVFGSISDGVLIEIFLARKRGLVTRFFSIHDDGRNLFEELPIEEVTLEDVSPWMWEWVLSNKNLERWHPRLRLKKTYPLVYPAYSKRNLFWNVHISKFCIQQHVIPLNPFMLFRYFLGDMVDRKTVYEANNSIVHKSDAIWVFGEISDGVLAEIQMARRQNIPVRYFKIENTNPTAFRAIRPAKAVFEEAELEQYRETL